MVRRTLPKKTCRPDRTFGGNWYPFTKQAVRKGTASLRINPWLEENI
jgi:hypothetical protein